MKEGAWVAETYSDVQPAIPDLGKLSSHFVSYFASFKIHHTMMILFLVHSGHRMLLLSEVMSAVVNNLAFVAHFPVHVLGF